MTGRAASAASRRFSSWRAACRWWRPRSASIARSSRDGVERLPGVDARGMDRQARAADHATRAARAAWRSPAGGRSSNATRCTWRRRSWPAVLRAAAETTCMSDCCAKNFAITGVAGYIAPRHLKAIHDTGNRARRGHRSARRRRHPRSALRSTCASSPRSSASTAISRSCAAVRRSRASTTSASARRTTCTTRTCAWRCASAPT